MKKSIIMVGILILLLVAASAQAEIKVQKDDFDGTTTIKSTFDIKSAFVPSSAMENTIQFNKDISAKGKSMYSFLASVSLVDWWFFAPQSAEVKVERTVKEEKVSEIIKFPFVFRTSKTGSGGYLWTGAAYLVPNTDAILSAEKLTIRIYYTNQPVATWSVPDKVLAEWKEVIKWTPPKTEAQKAEEPKTK